MTITGQRRERRHQLRERRRHLGHTQESLAYALGVSVSSVAQWERGVSTPTPRHRRHLAELLEVSLPELDLLLDPESGSAEGLVRPAPTWLSHLMLLEQTAGEVRAVEFVAVHGLLQTKAYAEAVIRSHHLPLTESDVASRVDLRRARQEALTRSNDPLQLHLLLDESVLLRPTGGPAVMVEQIEHLIGAMELPNVRLQVLPLDAAVYAAAAGSFYLLTRSGSRTPFLLYTESASEANYAETPSVIDNHVMVFRHLQREALASQQTVERLLRARETFDD